MKDVFLYLNYVGPLFITDHYIHIHFKPSPNRILMLIFSNHFASLQFMNEFDRAMNLLDEKFSILSSKKQIVSSTNEEDKVFIF